MPMTMIRMPRKIKDYLIAYVREYARRIASGKDKESRIELYNMFNAETAARFSIGNLLKKDLTDKELAFIQSEEGTEKIRAFFDEKILVNYFMLEREITYYEAKSLLKDKGTEYYEETKGMGSELYKGRFKDYPATDKQIDYIESFPVEIKHIEELSGREASLIISCLLKPNKTKPAYYTYYIKNSRV